MGEGVNDTTLLHVDPYDQFLRDKIKLGERAGFDVSDDEINPALKDHSRAIVRWAIGGGRRAVFASFGLHKTAIQLECLRLIGTRHAGIRLNVLPLGVRQEFFNDAARWFSGDHAIRCKFIRRAHEVDDDRTIYLTNYESVREGILDISVLNPVAVNLDEAAILRGFGGTKTFREAMAVLAGDDRRDRSQRVESRGIPFRIVATATPSPNEYIELLAYAAFLGIMDVGQAKTRFFKRDSTKADELTIHPHKEKEFWMWVSSWALFVTRPSDLGPEFSDDGYVLPQLTVQWHELPSDHSTAGAEKDGQVRLFRNAAIGVQEASREKRATIAERIAKTLEIILDDRRAAAETQSAKPGALPGEQGQIRREEQSLAPGESGALSGDSGATSRGESRQGARDKRPLVSGEQATCSRDDATAQAEGLRTDAGAVSDDSASSGSRVPDLPADARASYDSIGRSFARDGSSPGNTLQALQRGAGASRGESGEPGAGAGLSQLDEHGERAQVVVWAELNDEQRDLEKALAAVGVTHSSLYGSQSLEERERRLEDWRSGRTTVFLSKTSMYGAGVNLQRAHRMVFAGVHFKFHELVQGLHRIHRFGQSQPCDVHLIYTEAEREVRRELERKWRQHEELSARMTAIIREYGLSTAAMASDISRRSIGCDREEARGDRYVLVKNDAVEETRTMPADSVGLIITSVPFANMYEYSPSFNDFGHTDDNAHFWRQMDFLTPELFRVLRPGRVCAVHVKDRITPGGINGFGFQTVTRISDQCADHFERHGFAFLARKTIVTDVVRENNQTYRLGWSEQCKDGSRMGAGLPEYVLLFRKPPTDRSNGYADLPVLKEKTEYTRARWQYDAHGFTRSSGNRLLAPEDLTGLPQEAVFKLFRKYSLEQVYDFDRDLRIAEHVDHDGWLPSTFMLLPPQSWHPDVWTDVTRMRTLNADQSAKGKEMHLCPLQFDIVDRLILQFSMKDDEVYDPFSGLGTTPMRAVKFGRRGRGCELNGGYWRDSIYYCRSAELERATPSLFDVLETEDEEAAA